MTMRPSITDVAAKAGTSPATISRVLAGHPGVGPELRDRALRAIRELGYVPDKAAQTLRQKRPARACGLVHKTLIVASVCANVNDVDSFQRNQAATYDGMMEAAHDGGLHLVLKLVPFEQLDLPVAPPVFSGILYDGILASPDARVNNAGVELAGTVLWFSTRPRGVANPAVVETDNMLGMTHLFRHLVELGHRRIGFICENIRNPAYADRRNAFRALVGESGLERECVFEFTDAASRFEEVVPGFVRCQPRPTAIMSACDGLGVRLIEALQAAGFRVPDDVSVTGFDGRDKTRWCKPALTSWCVDWRAMGRTAVHQLVAMIQGKVQATRTLIGGRLLDQGSVGKPPAA